MRAYPWLLSMLIMPCNIVYTTDNVVQFLIELVMVGMTVIVYLLLSYFGNRYELKGGVVTACHYLRNIKNIIRLTCIPRP